MPPPREWPTIVAPLDPDGGQQVADAGGVGAEGVVAADRGAVAVAEQIGRDHRVALGELEGDLLPVLGGVDHAVDQHHGRAVAGDPVDRPVAVELDLPLVEDARNGQYGFASGGAMGTASPSGRALRLPCLSRIRLRPRSEESRLRRPIRRPAANPWRPVFSNRPRQDGQGYVSGALLGGYVVDPSDGRRLAANARIL